MKILKPHSDRYTLLMATNGQDALCMADQHEGKIDLLLSNVQMPGITGPDLAKELKKSRPEMRVMLMSGYPQGILLLDHGWTFLQKPFLPKAFLENIEKTLAGPPSGDGQSE